MADDNQNHGDESNGPILWGLSFALASAVAFKTIGALFPRRKTEEKYGDKIEKVTQINIPIIINMPSNLEDQVKLQQNASAADLVAPTNNVASNMLPNLSDQVKLLVSNLSDQAKLELSLKLSNLNDQVKLQLTNLQDQLVKPQPKKSPINKVANNISQNHQTTSQSKPEPLGPQVTCEQLIGGLLNDCKKHHSNLQCGSYSNIYRRFCSGPPGATISTKYIGSQLLLESFYGCMQGDYNSDSRKACREKYSKLLKI
ncbi:uncharacterized protein LOC107849518 [Capsicum annuum]|uniref:uncharacterized protein LOC107849518 n=1 Tax=Capsicum annuum TaxID=4072 RepID=UPI001FB18BB1|nr:uncharacterized protein LOC107849518 [Capsicum annuum]